MHSEIRQPVRIWEDFLLVQAAERTDCLQKAFWVWHGSDHMKPKVTRHTRSLSSQFDLTQLHFSGSTTDLLGSLRFYSLDIVGYHFIAIPQGKGNKLSILQVPSIPMNQFAQS